MKNSAIYITNNFVRLTQAKTNKNNHPLFKEYQLDIASLKENKIDGDSLTIVIPRSQVSVRYLNLPSVDAREIKKMVEYEVNNLFPCKPEELIFDEAVIEKKPDGYSRVMLVACPREVILRELSLLKQAGLIPDAIEISSVSLFNQFYAEKKDSANCLLINLEDNLLDIIVVHRQRLIFSRGKDFKDGEAEQGLIKEVKEIIDIQQAKGIMIDRILISGRGVDLKDLAQSLRQVLSIKVELDEKICISRGAAGGTRHNGLNINLLPEELKMQKSRERKRRFILYLITLLILNTSLIANLVFLNLREKQKYLYLLKSEISKIESQALALQKKMLRGQMIKSYLNSGRLSLGLLAELYRIAPAGVYLTSLEIRNHSLSGILVLTGQAKDTESVLKFASLIKESPLINKADVQNIAKRQSPSEEVVDFEIRATF